MNEGPRFKCTDLGSFFLLYLTYVASGFCMYPWPTHHLPDCHWTGKSKSSETGKYRMRMLAMPQGTIHHQFRTNCWRKYHSKRLICFETEPGLQNKADGIKNTVTYYTLEIPFSLPNPQPISCLLKQQPLFLLHFSS